MRHVLVVALAMAVGACAAPSPPATREPPPSVLLPAPPMSFWTLHGQPADRRTIQLHQGPGHCGWETATILSVPNPLGQVLTAANSLTYLRDPNGVLVGVAGAAPFGPSVSPPEDAVFTGYRWGPMELWVSPEAGLESVLLRRDGIWERWPRAMKEFGCM